MTTGAIRRAKLQSDRLHQQTSTQLFTGTIRALKEIASHSMDLITPSSPGSSNLVFDHQKLLVTLGEGCQASNQPSDSSTPTQKELKMEEMSLCCRCIACQGEMRGSPLSANSHLVSSFQQDLLAERTGIKSKSRTSQSPNLSPCKYVGYFLIFVWKYKVWRIQCGGENC